MSSKDCKNCKTPKMVVTKAGDFCLNCGTLAKTQSSVVGKAAPKPVARAAVKPVAKANPAATAKSGSISNFHKTAAAPNAEPATKIKVDSVSTPLLKHGKTSIAPTKK